MLYFQQVCGIVVYHGPNLVTPRTLEEVGARETLHSLHAHLFRRDHYPSYVVSVIHPGYARGQFVGGNLTNLIGTLGTPYAIETQGRILFVEDTGKAPHQIDRMLTHLRNAGKFDGIAGLVLADMHDCHGRDGLLWHVVRELFQDATFPVVYALPSGHGPRCVTLPLGTEVELNADGGVLRYLPPEGRTTPCSCTASSVRSCLAGGSSLCVAAGTRSWRGRRASTRRPACLLAAAPAVFVRQPVAQPCALRIAAALHGHLVARAPAVLAGRRGRVGRLAGGSGLVLAGGRLGGQGLLHRLLDQGLQVGRRAHRWDGGGGGGTAACPAAASRCWRSVSSWRCRSRAWSTLGRRKARYRMARFLTPPVEHRTCDFHRIRRSTFRSVLVFAL